MPKTATQQLLLDTGWKEFSLSEIFRGLSPSAQFIDGNIFRRLRRKRVCHCRAMRRVNPAVRSESADRNCLTFYFKHCQIILFAAYRMGKYERISGRMDLEMRSGSWPGCCSIMTERDFNSGRRLPIHGKALLQITHP